MAIIYLGGKKYVTKDRYEHMNMIAAIIIICTGISTTRELYIYLKKHKKHNFAKLSILLSISAFSSILYKYYQIDENCLETDSCSDKFLLLAPFIVYDLISTYIKIDEDYKKHIKKHGTAKGWNPSMF